jgi:dephospho-CoA kinase
MQNHTPLIIGLTGGIGSGKTTVANLFRNLGVEVIDADEISRRLVEPGSPALQAIVNHFGPEVIDQQDGLDRMAMRQIVFENPQEKAWLETLLHPAIRKEIFKGIKACRGDYVLLVVPLLLESGQYDFIDRLLVIDVPENLQVERAMARDGSTAKQIRQIMDAQVSRKRRLQQYLQASRVVRDH